jgi:hypothetical protein
MNLVEQILGGSSNPVGQIARQFGLDPQQASAAVASLVPALAGGLSRNTAAPGGLDGLLAALQGGGHQRYVDDPSTLAQPETTQDGNNILGHILGSKDASRQVAQQAAARTGIGADILKKMLPIVAGLVMGQLAKKQAAGGAEEAGGGGILGSLSGVLDADRDGKVEAGELLDMAKKIF